MIVARNEERGGQAKRGAELAPLCLLLWERTDVQSLAGEQDGCSFVTTASAAEGRRLDSKGMQQRGETLRPRWKSEEVRCESFRGLHDRDCLDWVNSVGMSCPWAMKGVGDVL